MLLISWELVKLNMTSSTPLIISQARVLTVRKFELVNSKFCDKGWCFFEEDFIRCALWSLLCFLGSCYSGRGPINACEGLLLKLLPVVVAKSLSSRGLLTTGSVHLWRFSEEFAL